MSEMRKMVVIALALGFILPAAATTITSQNITVDIQEDSVVNRIHVSELTSENFTYSSSHPVKGLEVSVNGETRNCLYDEGPVGGEISCSVATDSNFTVEMDYLTEGLVSDIGGSQIFTYSESVVIPTDRLNLRVVLPQGSGVIDPSNSSRPVITPPEGTTSSDGQNIFVEWNLKPDLGETVEFHVVYRNLSENNSLTGIIAVGAGILVLVLGGVLAVRYFIREELEEVYEDLEDDEVEVVDIMVENDGEILQKDLVDESGYSKAKISGTVSSLVDKGVLEKEKEGRSNKLSISSRFSF